MFSDFRASPWLSKLYAASSRKAKTETENVTRGRIAGSELLVGGGQGSRGQSFLDRAGERGVGKPGVSGKERGPGAEISGPDHFSQQNAMVSAG